MNALDSLIRKHIIDIPSYEPVIPHDVLTEKLNLTNCSIVKLDANENPYAPIPEVNKALAKLQNFNIYPDPESRYLRQALSNFHQIPADNIIVGAGADELIDLIMRLLLDPGDTLINCPPTFGMYEFDGGINNANIITIPRKENFEIDAQLLEKSIKKHRPKLLFLASPNNPDGSLLPLDLLIDLLEHSLVIVVDEAYIDFAAPGSSFINLVQENSNLIVLRTFSKWAGLAGLRIGYGIFPMGLAPHLWKIKQPYNVSIAAATAAMISLDHAAKLTEIQGRIVSERERLCQTLDKISWMETYPSQANFILCKIIGKNALDIKTSLEKQGILVRHFNNPGLIDHLRISVGKPEDTRKLVNKLIRME